jgi:pimeloyl-ACP methyl ester carboxylesterase
MEFSRRDLIASVTAGIALSTASAASTKAVANLYPGPASIGHRFIDANGLKVHIAEQGSGPLALLCHGFPESWYSWRHQIPSLAAAGYHVVAPDMRGYGGTDAPPERDSYTIVDLVGDMVGLVAALGEKKAIIVGHDWGATVAWHAALLRPDMFPVRRADRSGTLERMPILPRARLLFRSGRR